MYSIQERHEVQEFILAMAKSDRRIVDGALVGSEVIGTNDKWSDIDLTFGVRQHELISDILVEWTDVLAKKFNASHLFDLRWKSSLYRVLLLSNCLQVDISFTPTQEFGAINPKFKLLFGTSKQKPQKTAPNVQEIFGYAVHHALRARFSIERHRYWQAEYWLSACRDYALKIACLNHNLNSFDARGHDDLPEKIKNKFLKSLQINLTEKDLKKALKIVVGGLLEVSNDSSEITIDVVDQLKWIGNLN